MFSKTDNCSLFEQPLLSSLTPIEIEQVCFMSIGSGSSGNCYYFSSPCGSILIDVGLPLRMVEHALAGIGKTFKQLSAILVTHSHSDHSRSVARLSALYNIHVIAPEQVFLLLDNQDRKNRVAIHNRTYIADGSSFKVAGFNVDSFLVPHDCPECLGYVLTYKNFKLALLSDVGHYTPHHYRIARLVNHLVLESNYDREMLIKGNYPYKLKQRIAGPLGHTCNYEAAEFLQQVHHNNLKRVWLCHLSKENNTPERCYNAFVERFNNTKTELELGELISVLPRFNPSQPYFFAVDSTQNQP